MTEIITLPIQITASDEHPLLAEAEEHQILWKKLLALGEKASSDALRKFATEEGRGKIPSTSADQLAVIIFRHRRDGKPLVLPEHSLHFGHQRCSVRPNGEVRFGVLRFRTTPGHEILANSGALYRTADGWVLKVKPSFGRAPKSSGAPKKAQSKDRVAELGSHQLPSDGRIPVSLRLGRREDLIKLSLGWIKDNPLFPTGLIYAYR